MSIIYEGVTFVKRTCSKMTKAEFVNAHLGVFWKDKDEKTRRKMLNEVYDKIVPPKAEEKPPKAEEEK